MMREVESSKLSRQAGSGVDRKVQSENENRSVTVKLSYAKISAQKLNLTAKILRGKSLLEGQTITNFAKTKASQILSKLLKSAKAVALSKGLKVDDLLISALLTNQGPSLSRGRPVARGTYHAIRKKSAHVALTLKEVNYGTKS